MEKNAIFKYNSGNLAILCSNCSKIIKTGRDFSENEMSACKGLSNLNAQYCDSCKTNNRDTKIETIFKN